MAESKPVKTTIFRYSIGRKTYTLSSTSPSTVLNALLTNHDFKKTYNDKTKAGKDIIIQRGKSHRPAISVNFPCCLLEDNELLHIRFIKHDRSSHGPNTVCDLHLKNPDDLMVFLVNTTGGKNIQNAVMENNRLKGSKVNWVCVVAVKGETVKEALRRDGRFAKGIFKMDGALEDDEWIITDIQNLVNELKEHKLYTIFRNSPEVMPNSQEMLNSQDDLDDQPQSNSEADPADSSQHSKIPNAQSSGKASLASDKKEMTTTTKSECTKYENIPNTTEIFKILCTQFDSLVKQLKAREDFKTPGKVQQLLREEFSKETQCFSEIKTVKALMDLSASVCQVRHYGQARGTGFLLFGTCILTNAHVITDAQGQLLDKLSVAFDFEDLETGSKQFAIKKKLVAYELNYTEQHTMDYAVLELKTSAEALPPPLLKHYKAALAGKGVCIIGHPAEGVKKMDMSLIIERLKQEDAVNKHKSDHPECFQIITETYFKRRQELDGNQIEYHSCFFHGSSGSPVFDECGNVIGMHTGGYVYKKGKGSFDSIIEFALPLLPILLSILRQTKDKRSDVWEFFPAEKNTKLVRTLADNMKFQPESTNSCVLDNCPSDEEDMNSKSESTSSSDRDHLTADEEDMISKPESTNSSDRDHLTADEEDMDSSDRDHQFQ